LKRFWAALALCGLLLVGGRAHAQVAIYGMGSGGFLSSVNAQSGPLTLTSASFSAYGGTFGVYDNYRHLGPVKFGGDGRFFIQSKSNGNSYGNQLRGGLVGARLALFSHAVPFSPYIQAEIGGVGTNYGTQSQRSTSFAYQVQGGLDYTIVPHLDARFEYGAGQIGALFPGTRQEMQQIGLGLVVRIY
jgi:hypothetical protein